jgi:hypothetical protein
MKLLKSSLLILLTSLLFSFTYTTELVQITYISCKSAGTKSIPKSSVATFIAQQTAFCGSPPLVIINEK